MDAVYFSRSPIPFSNKKNFIGFKQVCVIPFRRKFLDLYNDLNHKKGNEYDHYCLNDSYCPLLYYKPDNSVMISRDKIWSFFSNGLDYDIDETRKILKNWVESTYGLEFNR